METPPAPARSRLRQCCRWLIAPWLHILLWAVSLGLAALLLIQSAWIFGLVSGKPIPLPGRLLRMAEHRLESGIPGAEVRIESLSLRADGMVDSRGIALYLEGSNVPFATLDHAELDFSLTWLILGRLVPESVQFRGGTIFCPLIFSPTGAREQVVDAMSGKLVMKEGKLAIDFLQLQALDIPVSADGAWRYPFSLQSEDTARGDWDKAGPLMVAAGALGQVLTLRPHTDWLENPALHVHFQEEPQRAPGIQVTVQAGYAHLEERFSLHRMRAQTAMSWDREWHFSSGIQLSVDSLEVEGYGSARQLDLDLDIPTDSGFHIASLYRSALTVNVAGLETPYADTDKLRLRAHAGKPGIFHYTLLAEAFDGSLRAEGQVNSLNRSSTVTVRFREANLYGIGDILTLLNYELPEGVELPASTTGIIELTLDQGWEPSRLDFDFHARTLRYNGQEIEGAAAAGHYRFTDPYLQLDHFRTRFPEGEIEGSGSYSFPEEHLQISLQPRDFQPTQLNAMLPPWWEKLWEDFAFQGPLPSGNFYLENRFDTRHTLFCYGEARFRQTEFRGIPFDDGSCRLLLQAALIDIFDLEATRADQFTRGSLTWVYDPAIQGLKYMTWDIDSQVPPDQARKIFDEPVRSIFDDFETLGRTDLTSRGSIYNKKRVPDLVRLNRVQVSGVTPDPVIYKGYLLDSLDLNANYTPKNLQIDLESIGIADGIAGGSLNTRFAEDGDTLDFEINLLGANKDKLLALAKRFDATAPPDPETPPAPPPPPPPDSSPPGDSGQMDVRIQAGGPLGDPFGFTGRGFFVLRDPNLARIRLLGQLGTDLERTPVPFGSLVLNKMGSEFILDRDRVRFPNMRITGPVTRIKARGDYSLTHRDLDFDVQVFLGNPEESALLSMVTSVFRPITYALELNLTGSLDNPSWKFTHLTGAPDPVQDPAATTESTPRPPRSTTDSNDAPTPSPFPADTPDFPPPP